MSPSGRWITCLGAIDTSTFLTNDATSTLSIPVVTYTTTGAIGASDRGKLVQLNPSGGNFTRTLDAAATLGDGWNAEFRNSGTSGQAILAASQAIAFEGQTFTSRALRARRGHDHPLRWHGLQGRRIHAAFDVLARTGRHRYRRSRHVCARLARHRAPATSSDSAFDTYATGDIIEANGTTFNKYTPADRLRLDCLRSG